VNRQEKAQWIKGEAKRLGFLFCGISTAEFLEREAPLLEQWLNQNYHGEMAYMANHFDKRLDPRKLVEGAESVISLAYNYFPAETPSDPLAPKIARYAYGEDYHKVMKDKIYLMVESIREKFGDIQGRVFVDSAPVMERAWAEKSGLGWIGKNTLLINKNIGSYFFLGEIILDLKLDADHSTPDHCGTCTRCIDACPTQAITQAGVLDASRCISYHTIELKSSIPEEFQNKMENWAFGCDICQEVCPWNRFSNPHEDSRLKANPELMNLDLKAWEEITEEIFNQIFHSSPLKRAGYHKLKETIKILNI
jgi:epoxyqueuosine reductase